MSDAKNDRDNNKHIVTNNNCNRTMMEALVAHFTFLEYYTLIKHDSSVQIVNL